MLWAGGARVKTGSGLSEEMAHSPQPEHLEDWEELRSFHYLCLFFIFAECGIKLRVLYFPSKGFTSELHLKPQDIRALTG